MTRAVINPKTNLSEKDIENYSIMFFSECYKKYIMLYGFYFDSQAGLYTFGPREELEKLNKVTLEEFDIDEYIKTAKHDFILADWIDPSNPKLNKYFLPKK